MEPECPELRKKGGVIEDEICIAYICDIKGRQCHREHGYDCEIYDEWLKEEQGGKDNCS